MFSKAEKNKLANDESKTKALFQFDNEQREIHGFETIIGVDEVGLGCVAGPVVAVALSFDTKLTPAVFEILTGLNDSKALSKRQREFLLPNIAVNSRSGLGVASVQEINLHGLQQAGVLAMARAVSNLNERFNIQKAFVLVDGKNVIPGLDLDQITVIKGDSQSASISAASITAKIYRDELMTNYSRLYPGYDWHVNFGYLTEVHQKAIATLGLSPLHRASYQCLDSILVE